MKATLSILIVFFTSATLSLAHFPVQQDQDAEPQAYNGLDGLPIGGFVLPTFQRDETMQPLLNPSVMKDLEIVEEQRQELNKIQQKFSKRTQSIMNQFISSGQLNLEAKKKMALELSGLEKEKTLEFSKVLLPHQLERIKQVSHQIQVKNRGVAGALNYGKLSKELKVTDEQKKKFAEIQQQLYEDIKEKTKQLNEAAMKRVLAELSLKQRDKYKQLTGSKFEVQQEDLRGQFRQDSEKN